MTAKEIEMQTKAILELEPDEGVLNFYISSLIADRITTQNKLNMIDDMIKLVQTDIDKLKEEK